MENQSPKVAVVLVLNSSTWRGRKKLPKILGRFSTRELAEKARQARLERTPEHVRCPSALQVLGPVQYKKLLTEIKAEQAGNRKAGAQKAAAERKRKGIKPNFILCPTCGAKSKKLFSEMGGLQTRRCQNGHSFEKDMYMGGVIPARRVENTDRPLFTGIPYNDYVYGRFKNDPTGKGGV